MELPADIKKHLFYSSWALMILQMLLVATSTIPIDSTLLIVISQVVTIAYNCAIILFAIGLLRMNSHIDFKFWKYTSFLLIVASLIDLVHTILFFIFEEQWTTYSFLIVRIVFIITTLVLIATAFVGVKKIIDTLYSLKITGRGGKFYLSFGNLLLLFPYIVGWYADYISPRYTESWLQQSSFFIFLLSTFFIILGYLDLGFTLKSLRDEDKDILSNLDSEEDVLTELPGDDN